MVPSMGHGATDKDMMPPMCHSGTNVPCYQRYAMLLEACHGATDVPWCQRHAMVLQMGDGGTDKAMKRQMWHNASNVRWLAVARVAGLAS